MPVGDFENIKFPQIVDRMGGTAQKMFLVPYRDFLVMQEPTSGSYKINTAHTFQSGKGAIEVYVIQDTGELNFESIGGFDRASFMAKVMFDHPGEADAIDKFSNECKNEQWVAFVPLPGSQELYQLGNKEFQFSIKPSYTTGKNSGDGRTSKFEGQCLCANKIKYAATLTMKPSA